MANAVDPSKRKPRWYFGGVSSACAACITHPLDLVKVCRSRPVWSVRVCSQTLILVLYSYVRRFWVMSRLRDKVLISFVTFNNLVTRRSSNRGIRIRAQFNFARRCTCRRSSRRSLGCSGWVSACFKQTASADSTMASPHRCCGK